MTSRAVPSPAGTTAVGTVTTRNRVAHAIPSSSLSAIVNLSPRSW